MGSRDRLEGDALAWLLEAESPGVRYLALRDLEGGDDARLRAARRAAYRDGPIAAVLSNMDPSGFWAEPGPGYLPKYRSTVWSIVLLAQLGAAIADDERVGRACAYVLDHTLTGSGQFSASGVPSGTADCIQGNLCRALVELGSDDPRLELAFEWMARSVTGDGVASVTDRRAAIRYYAGKCGPTFACGSNNKLPCAWGAVKVMLAFGIWPPERRTPMIERAVAQGAEFLLEPDPATAAYPCGYSDKPSGNWWKFGFPVFYVTDLLQNVEALIGAGYGGDPRLRNALDVIRGKRDELGRWSLDYDYAGKTWADFGRKRQPNKWVTLRALRVLRSATDR